MSREQSEHPWSDVEVSRVDPSTSRDRYGARMRTQLAACERELDSLRHERVEGLHGQSLTVDRAEERVEMLEMRVEMDIDNNVCKHNPVDTGHRRLARVAPFADLLVFLYFLAVVLNVDLDDPRQTPVVTVLAAVLAVLATTGVAWTLRSVAARLRQDKPDDNRFRWRQRSRAGAIGQDRAILAFVLVGVGSMMFYRIYVDATDSELAVAPTLLLALFFALIAVSLNYDIFLVEFEDGSLVTDEVRHLRARLDPVQERRTALDRTCRELRQLLDQR